MDKTQRKYAFSWDFIGDVQSGRPCLGQETTVAVYRLFMYSLRDVLETHCGAEGADALLREAGFLAGRQFAEHFIGRQETLNAFFLGAQKALREQKIGVLRMELAEPDNGHFVLTVSEDVDCSGLPETGFSVCVYDEGFIAGLFFYHSGRRFHVREVDCWCTGDRTCRFEVHTDG